MAAAAASPSTSTQMLFPTTITNAPPFRILVARCRCNLALGRFREALKDAEDVMEATNESGKLLVDDDEDPDVWSTKAGAAVATAALCKAEALFQLGNFENAFVWYYRQSRMRNIQVRSRRRRQSSELCTCLEFHSSSRAFDSQLKIPS